MVSLIEKMPDKERLCAVQVWNAASKEMQVDKMINCMYCANSMTMIIVFEQSA